GPPSVNLRAFGSHSLLHCGTRQHARAMCHDAGYSGGVDAVTFYPGGDREEVRIADRVFVTRYPRTLQELVLDQLKAFRHVRRHFALHSLDRGSIVRPPGAPHAVGMRDMHRRTKIAVELLNLRQGKRIGEWGELGLRKALCDKAQERGRFGKRAAFGYQ